MANRSRGSVLWPDFWLCEVGFGLNRTKAVGSLGLRLLRALRQQVMLQLHQPPESLAHLLQLYRNLPPNYNLQYAVGYQPREQYFDVRIGLKNY